MVTGASRGFGRALVQELSAAGWSVVAVSRQPAPSAEWESAPGIETVAHDVRSDNTDALLAAVGGRRVDVLINNAAQGAPHSELGSVAPQGVLNAVDVNVGGPLRLVQALLPNLMAAPDPIIINVTSRLGSVSAQARGDFAKLSTSYAYRISKAAQNMLTISLANDLRDQVRCWAVHPGKLATDMGQPDAAKLPQVAARELVEVLDSHDRTSPRFCSLGEGDLSW